MKWECDKATDRNADVWILNEVDWGVKRTQYREVIRELGETLNMNWAFGVEFLEVDSKQLGTDAFDDGEEQDSRQNLLEEFKVDKDRLLALHGNAVCRVIQSVRPGSCHSQLATTGSKKAKSGPWRRGSGKRRS